MLRLKLQSQLSVITGEFLPSSKCEHAFEIPIVSYILCDLQYAAANIRELKSGLECVVHAVNINKSIGGGNTTLKTHQSYNQKPEAGEPCGLRLTKV